MGGKRRKRRPHKARRAAWLRRRRLIVEARLTGRRPPDWMLAGIHGFSGFSMNEIEFDDIVDDVDVALDALALVADDCE